MKLNTLVKLVTVISVLLFSIAVGYYAFIHLSMADRNRTVNLYSLVPADCSGVLESDDISAYLHELPNLNYGNELECFQFPGLFGFVIDALDGYAAESAHGLSPHLNRLLVSFHEPYDVSDQVVYFQTGGSDETFFSDLFRGYMPGHFLSKEEEYRGETIVVYPLNHEEYLSVYTDAGFMVISFQKKLIEKVIDTRLDETSLDDDISFSRIHNNKKKHFLTLYTCESTGLMSEFDVTCWNEYDFHMNSDILYLTGETFVSTEEDVESLLSEYMRKIPVLRTEGLFVSADKDSTQYYMEKSYEANESGEFLLFNECIYNLSDEAFFSLVADMQAVSNEYEILKSYLPSFIGKNVHLFSPFVLSAQYTWVNNRLSHIWTFTYKY